MRSGTWNSVATRSAASHLSSATQTRPHPALDLVMMAVLSGHDSAGVPGCAYWEQHWDLESGTSFVL